MFIDAGLESGSERARLDGLIDLFHCIKFDPSTGSIELPINYVPGYLDSIPSSKYPPAEPGALVREPLEAANQGR